MAVIVGLLLAVPATYGQNQNPNFRIPAAQTGQTPFNMAMLGQASSTVPAFNPFLQQAAATAANPFLATNPYGAAASMSSNPYLGTGNLNNSMPNPYNPYGHNDYGPQGGYLIGP